MMTLAEAMAARAKAREHWWHGVEPTSVGFRKVCIEDHRTDAERDADALAACANLASYFEALPEHERRDYADYLGLMYDAIQRTEGPQ